MISAYPVKRAHTTGDVDDSSVVCRGQGRKQCLNGVESTETVSFDRTDGYFRVEAAHMAIASNTDRRVIKMSSRPQVFSKYAPRESACDLSLISS